jgi:Cell wall-associated hydrolases (invasion-associated proteins)
MNPTEILLSFALQYVGIPYKYGGLDTTGMDCTGFVGQVFKRFNVETPRRARDFVNFGQPVPIEEIRPGDILLFKFKHKFVDHVGIYLGDGMVIHSASKRGVVVDSLKYIKKNLVGARRVYFRIPTLGFDVPNLI